MLLQVVLAAEFTEHIENVAFCGICCVASGFAKARKLKKNWMPVGEGPIIGPVFLRTGKKRNTVRK